MAQQRLESPPVMSLGEKFRGYPWTPLLLLMLLAAAAYGPVIGKGGFIWDDPDYVVHNPLIRDAEGLVRIWTEPRSLPQYYPLVHTTYWVEYQLWGLRPGGYHATNVLLHGGAAGLFYLLLRKLRVPGAWVAGAIFAVHPVMAESVAWVTERKNTLSLVLYLGAFLAYWRHVEGNAKERGYWGWYGGALGLFCGAMLSKTVACSFPAAMVLVLWWRRGRVTRGDWVRLAPFFVIGAGLGLYTAYLERTHVGAMGAEFDELTPIKRVLIASRAVWFYVGKLAWPGGLSFIYPRWKIEPGVWWQWLPVAGCVAATGMLAAGVRRWGRGPLVAWLFFVGTLLPALGFFNVYPMRYSFVADHFQYHAALGLFALAGAGLAWAGKKMGRAGSIVGAGVLILVLGGMTFARGFVYESARTLWADTARRNPGSWMVHVNLGHALVEENDLDGAEREYELAGELAPEQPEALINVGGMLVKRGRYDEGIALYRRALAARENYPPALLGMGNALLAQKNPREAKDWYEKAAAADRTYEQAQYKLGVTREALGDAEGARQAYEASVAADPEEADAMYNLGNLYRANGRAREAVYWYRRAIAVRPGRAELHVNLAATLWQTGQQREAVEEYAAAARLDPKLGEGIRRFLAQKGITLPG